MAGKTVFLSHASEDAAAVLRIVDYLERSGVTCWIAERDIPPRAIYAEAITEAVKDAQACGVAISQAANGSVGVKREVELASRYERPFIPIRLDATEPGPGLDYYLGNVQWIEYGRDGEAALDRIVAHLTGQRFAPPPPAPKKILPWRAIAAGAALMAIIVLAFFSWPRPKPTPGDTPAATEIARMPDTRLAPNADALMLASGFLPDPKIVAVQAGGVVDAAVLNSQAPIGRCAGNIGRAPDVRLHYTASNQAPLNFSVDAGADTTLVINGPDNKWYCNDDTGAGDQNPIVRFANPSSGQYDIWIGRFGESALRPANLMISERHSP